MPMDAIPPCAIAASWVSGSRCRTQTGSMSIADLRREYRNHFLTERTPPPTRPTSSRTGSRRRSVPQLLDANAMTLATVSRRRRALGAHRAAQGRGRSRLRVLHQLRKRARAAIWRQPARLPAVFWAELERQVRITGAVARVAARSTAYFRSRPRESQIGAWIVAAEPARSPIAACWKRASAELTAKFDGDDVPRAAVLGRLPRHARARSSSGRAGRAACTIDCSTRARRRVGQG